MCCGLNKFHSDWVCAFFRLISSLTPSLPYISLGALIYPCINPLIYLKYIYKTAHRCNYSHTYRVNVHYDECIWGTFYSGSPFNKNGHQVFITRS